MYMTYNDNYRIIESFYKLMTGNDDFTVQIEYAGHEKIKKSKFDYSTGQQVEYMGKRNLYVLAIVKNGSYTRLFVSTPFYNGSITNVYCDGMAQILKEISNL